MQRDDIWLKAKNLIQYIYIIGHLEDSVDSVI